MKREEADDLVEQLRNGQLREEIVKWDRAKKAEKEAEKQRKEKIEAEKRSRMLRRSRKHVPAHHISVEEVNDILSEFRAVCDARISEGTNTITEERGSAADVHTVPFDDNDARKAMQDVRALHLHGYITQSIDMGDNEAVDLAK